MKNNLQIFVRSLFILFAILLIGFILQANIAPFGKSSKLSTDIKKDNIKLEPQTRVTQLPDTTLQLHDDLVYFSTNMTFKFDKATIKITFKNNNLDQEIHLGFQDRESYHYDTKLIDSNILNDLSWSFVDDSPRLYQKNKVYNSYQDFLANLPADSLVGFYDFEANVLKQTYIPDYSPSSSETVINTPMRGKVVLYVYLNNEPFKMWVSKQDLNWYEDPDPVNIKIYKDKDVVYSSTIDDDGITDSSNKVLPPMEAYIQNPGPDLPESGVYKVVIDSGRDSIIKSIRTNLHKIIFDSPLNLVSNSDEYPQIIEKTTENKVFSNALVLSAQTLHNSGLQDIKIGDSILKLIEVKKEESTKTAQPISEVTIPKSDVVLRGLLGNFAFSKEQFFTPSKFKLLPITEKGDIETVNYIITNYKPSLQQGEWRVAEAEFDLKTAYIEDGKLRWIIRAPGLKENGTQIIIKKIEVEFSKKPLIEF